MEARGLFLDKLNYRACDPRTMLLPDDLDRKIMRELESPGSLRWNIRESYASIAKKVDVDEETVRKRVVRVRNSGLILGWQLIVNPYLIGREAASVELDVELTDKSPAIAQLKLMDGVISILNFEDKGVQVGIYYEHEKALQRQIVLMEAICEGKHSHLWKVPFPQCRLRMTTTDWVLLQALRKDPRKKLVDAAHEAQVSTRTFKRRLDRMEESFAFFLHALVDFKKLGGLAYRMLVYSDHPDKKATVDEMILTKVDRIEWSHTFSQNYSMFVIHCENTLQADEISNFVGKAEGVDELRMNIIKEQITVQDWIEDEILSRIVASP